MADRVNLQRPCEAELPHVASNVFECLKKMMRAPFSKQCTTSWLGLGGKGETPLASVAVAAGWRRAGRTAPATPPTELDDEEAVAGEATLSEA